MPLNESEEIAKASRKLRRALAWGVFLLFAAICVLMAYRIWYYADKIRRGEIVNLPQFEGNLTVAGEARLGVPYVERSAVESPTRPSLGAATDAAKLTIVMFGDYGCGYSAEVNGAVRAVVNRHKEDIRLVYRHYPIESIHPNATLAAEAAECAGEQDRFWPYHDRLYASQSTRQMADLVRFAEQLGLDSRAFEQCLAGGKYRGAVEADVTAATGAGVYGTPTFFFNGERVEGAIPEAALENIVTRLIGRK